MPTVDPQNMKHFQKARESLSDTSRRKSSISEANPIRDQEQFSFDVEMPSLNKSINLEKSKDKNQESPKVEVKEQEDYESVQETIDTMVWYMRVYGLEKPSWERPLCAIWYYTIRLMILAGLLVKVIMYFELSPIMMVACDIPMALAFMVGFFVLIPVEKKCGALRRDLEYVADSRRSRASSVAGGRSSGIDRKRMVSVESVNSCTASELFLQRGDMASSGKFAAKFVAIFFVLGVASSLLVAHGKSTNALDGVAYFVIYLALTSVSTFALGAVLFALSVDVARSRNDLAVIARTVKDMTLEPVRYIEARERALDIKRGWNMHLNTVALVALYNSFGMLILAPMNAGMALEFYLDFVILVSMGKEMFLFIIILVIVMRVNDDADEIASSLSAQTWGAFDSEAEWRRNKLYTLATYTGPKPGSHVSIWKFVKTGRLRPVSFTLCGFRPTAKIVMGITISLLLSVIGTISHRIANRTFQSDQSMKGMSEM